jgi:hypothetical protein
VIVRGFGKKVRVIEFAVFNSITRLDRKYPTAFETV